MDARVTQQQDGEGWVRVTPPSTTWRQVLKLVAVSYKAAAMYAGLATVFGPVPVPELPGQVAACGPLLLLMLLLAGAVAESPAVEISRAGVRGGRWKSARFYPWESLRGVVLAPSPLPPRLRRVTDAATAVAGFGMLACFVALARADALADRAMADDLARGAVIAGAVLTPSSVMA